MRQSTRNQLPGTIVNIELGGVMAVVSLELDGGQRVTAVITRAAVEELGLAVGHKATALIKSTEVSLAID